MQTSLDMIIWEPCIQITGGQFQKDGPFIILDEPVYMRGVRLVITA